MHKTRREGRKKKKNNSRGGMGDGAYPVRVARCEARGGADCRAELHWKALVTPKVIAAFAALGALSLLPVLLRRRAGRRPTGAA